MTGILQPLITRETTTSLSSSVDERSHHARKLLTTRPSGVRGERTSVSDKEMVRQAGIQECIIFPWMTAYKIWWTITAVGAIFTVFFVPFQIAFNDASAVVEYALTLIFVVDIFVNFNLAFYKEEILVFERREIFHDYFGGMFWIDFIGVFPFETFALLLAGNPGGSNNEALYFSLLRLLQFVRLHRMKRLSYVMQYDARISLLWFTLIRNFGAVLTVTHLAACAMYFLARLHDFDETTWLGPHVEGLDGFERYVAALYWSIVTFCTVGKIARKLYCFSPQNVLLTFYSCRLRRFFSCFKVCLIALCHSSICPFQILTFSFTASLKCGENLR